METLKKEPISIRDLSHPVEPSLVFSLKTLEGLLGIHINPSLQPSFLLELGDEAHDLRHSL
jgi:hypothetical protein